MTTLKKNKILQMIIGIFSAVLLLFAGYISGEKISFPETDFGNKAELIILVGYMFIYTATLSLLAIFSKSRNLKYTFYPAFAICLTSVVSALIHWRIEESLWLIVMPLSEYFGMPIRAFTKAMENATTYINTTYEYEETFLYEQYTLAILLLLSFISVAIYQLYTETAEQDAIKRRWHLEGPARTASIAIIVSYGIFIFLDFLCYLLPQSLFTGILGILLGSFCIIATWLTVPVTLPAVLIGYVLKEVISEARFHSNPRLYFNPLVISAITICIIGSVIMVKTMLSCF